MASHDTLSPQDSLSSEADLSQYFVPDMPGSLSDFVVAVSEDEDHAGSGCSTSEDSNPPPTLSSKSWVLPRGQMVTR